MTVRLRKSVPTQGMARWWECGWSYVMPDFDTRDHSIIEWLSDRPPVEPSDDAQADELAAAVGDLNDKLARCSG